MSAAPGSSTSCTPYGAATSQIGVQGGVFCSAPPGFLFLCTDVGAPRGFDECFKFDSDPRAYCAHDACVRDDAYDSTCAAQMLGHQAWECSSDNASTLPGGCASGGEARFWCCP